MRLLTTLRELQVSLHTLKESQLYEAVDLVNRHQQKHIIPNTLPVLYLIIEKTPKNQQQRTPSVGTFPYCKLGTQDGVVIDRLAYIFKRLF